MTSKVFCGGLAWATNEASLQAAMEEHFGPVREVKIVMDRETGKSKGFGFVTFQAVGDAAQAVEAKEFQLDGRTVRMDLAKERERSPRRGGDSPRGGGGPGGRGRGSSQKRQQRQYEPEPEPEYEERSGGRDRGRRGQRRSRGRGRGGRFHDGGGYSSGDY